MTELQNGLPPGWDCLQDEKTGRSYFVNHFTKTTTWEDPRNRHRQFQNASKHLNNVSVEYIPLQDMKPTTRSPLTLRSAKVKDSSFTVASSHSSTDSEDSVSKIAAMFPTVSDTHIKLLLKNCRYMKSIFPKADETIILEVLQNNDNSIQKSSDVLKDMGYDKKDTVKQTGPKVQPTTSTEVEEVENKASTVLTRPAVKTNEEKKLLREKLQIEYKDVPEHLIIIALESVHFDENRANQILKIMKQEDSENESNNQKQKILEDESTEEVVGVSTSKSTTQLPTSQSRQSLKSLLKGERRDEVIGFCRIIEEIDLNPKYSRHLSNTVGHNPDICRGTNDKLLLENYIQWQGSNKNIRKGSQGLAKGPNQNLLTGKIYTPCGPNADLRKGPARGLAKGSIFNQLKSVAVGESGAN